MSKLGVVFIEPGVKSQWTTLQGLHSADDATTNWLEGTAVKAFNYCDIELFQQ